MTTKIHHNTAKRARTLGITLAVVDGDVVASKDGVTLATGLQGNLVLDAAVAKLNGAAPSAKRAKLVEAFKSGVANPRKPIVEDDEKGDDEDQDDEQADDEDSDADQGKSIVKRKYKTLYQPTKMTCGDDLAYQISDHVSETVEVDGKEITRLSMKLLKRFAKANDCWVESYASLNIGQARMNVGNRLRAKVKKGHVVDWA